MFVVPLCESFYLCLVVTCVEGLTSWISFVVYTVGLSLSRWYPGSGVVLILSIPDLFTLSFLLC